MVERVGGMAELARRTGIGLTSIKRWLRGAKPRAHQLDRLADGGGVRREWLRTGDRPMQEGVAREEEADYVLINPDLMGMILKSVEELLPAESADQRAGLAALAYEYMTARRSTDQAVLAHFFRQWMRSVRPQPAVPDFHSPEVAGPRDQQGDLFSRREADNKAAAGEPRKGRRQDGKPKGEK